MSHLLAFCRESQFVANTRFLGLFCADIWDLTQILHRYLDQKSAAGSSDADYAEYAEYAKYAEYEEFAEYIDFVEFVD